MFSRYSIETFGLLNENQKSKTDYQKSYNQIKAKKIKLDKKDIVKRFIDFVEDVYGSENLESNLDFIAKTLNKGEPVKVIENYFKEEFYLSHYKVYRQKPIYVLNKKAGLFLSYIFN